MHIAVATEVHKCLIPGLRQLCDALAAKEEEFKDIIKMARTHTQVCEVHVTKIFISLVTLRDNELMLILVLYETV